MAKPTLAILFLAALSGCTLTPSPHSSGYGSYYGRDYYHGGYGGHGCGDYYGGRNYYRPHGPNVIVTEPRRFPPGHYPTTGRK